MKVIIIEHVIPYSFFFFFFSITVIDPRERAKGEGKGGGQRATQGLLRQKQKKKREKREAWILRAVPDEEKACEGGGRGKGQSGDDLDSDGPEPLATVGQLSSPHFASFFFEPSLHTQVEEDPIVFRPTTPFVSILPARLSQPSLFRPYSLKRQMGLTCTMVYSSFVWGFI